MRQHFHIICSTEFQQNVRLHGAKIQAMFVWGCCPAAEHSVFSAQFAFFIEGGSQWRARHQPPGGWRWPTPLVQSAVPLQLLPWVCFWRRHWRLSIVEWSKVQMPQTETCFNCSSSDSDIKSWCLHYIIERRLCKGTKLFRVFWLMLTHVLPEIIEEEVFVTRQEAPSTGGSVDIYVIYLSQYHWHICSSNKTSSGQLHSFLQFSASEDTTDVISHWRLSFM